MHDTINISLNTMWTKTICHGLEYVVNLALSNCFNLVNKNNDILTSVKFKMAT